MAGQNPGTTAETMPDPRPSVAPMAIPREIVARQVSRICAHGEFARSQLVKKLLQYMVEKTVDPVPDGLKERSLATNVFDRDESWDPKIDPVVRLTAMRLRTKLDAYYETIGNEDEVLIRVPKGQYGVQIELRQPVVESATPDSAEFPTPPVRSTPSQSFFFRGLLLPVLAVVALYAVSEWRQRTRKPLVLTSTPLITNLGKQFAPTLSPDGSTVAYDSDEDGHAFEIYTRSIANGNVRRLTGSAEPSLNPAWSPNGKTIAFVRVGSKKMSLMVTDTATGTERQVAEFPAELGAWTGDSSPLLGNPGPEWTSDGGSLLLSVPFGSEAGHAIVRVSLKDGRVQPIVAASGELRDYYPKLSPDGKYLSFARFSSHGTADLYVANADGSSPRRLTEDRRGIQGLAWESDSRTIVFATNRSGSFQLWSEDVDRGNEQQVPLSSSSAAQPAISGDRLVYVETVENWNIWQSEVQKGTLSQPVRLLASSGRNYDPRISPDQSQIAFVSDRSGGWQLWLASRDGKQLRQLTHLETSWLGSPCWSADGKRIAFDARPHGHAGIFQVNIATGAVSTLYEGKDEARSPGLSRDGNSLYFNSNRDGSVAIYKLDLKTRAVQRVTGPDTFASAESLDGRFLFYSSQQPGKLWRANPDGNAAEAVVAYPIVSPSMAWALFDHGLYFASTDPASRESVLYSLEEERIKEIGRSKAPVVPYTPSLGASADGRYLLVAQQDQVRSDIKMSSLESLR